MAYIEDNKPTFNMHLAGLCPLCVVRNREPEELFCDVCAANQNREELAEVSAAGTLILWTMLGIITAIAIAAGVYWRTN